MICFFCLNKNLSNKKICVICQFGLFTDIWSNGFIDGIHYCINIRINLFREKYPHYAEAFNLSLKPGVDLRDYSNLLHRKNVDDRLLKQDRRSEINQIVNQEINLHLNNLFLLKKTVNFREIDSTFLGNCTRNEIELGICKLVDMRVLEVIYPYFDKKSTPYQNTKKSGSNSKHDVNSDKKRKTSSRSQTKANSHSKKTRKSREYVYVLLNEYSPNIHKIGFTRRHPDIRASEISRGTGVVGTWEVEHYWEVEDGYWVEQRLFDLFAQYRLEKSEMFKFISIDTKMVISQISEHIKNHGTSPREYERIMEEKAQYRQQCESIQNQINIKVNEAMEKRLKPILDERKQGKKWFYALSLLISFIITQNFEKNSVWVFLLFAVLSYWILEVIYNKFSKEAKNSSENEANIRNVYSKYIVAEIENDCDIKKLNDILLKVSKL